MEACAFIAMPKSPMLCVDVVSTTVSTIIITSSSISAIIAKSISNQGMISSCTSLYQMAGTFRTGIGVCIHRTAVPTIIVAVCIVGLIVAETIADQCNISTQPGTMKKITMSIKTNCSWTTPRFNLCIGNLPSQTNDHFGNFFFQGFFTLVNWQKVGRIWLPFAIYWKCQNA